MTTNQNTKQIEPEKIYQWINELCTPSTRENALVELRYLPFFFFFFTCFIIIVIILLLFVIVDKEKQSKIWHQCYGIHLVQ